MYKKKDKMSGKVMKNPINCKLNFPRGKYLSNKKVKRICELLSFIFLLLYSTKSGVICIGVKTPSASAATSLSMASSLFNSMSMHPDDNNSINDIENSGRKRTPEECKVKNLKQQQRMTMAKLDAHRCLIRDTVVAVPVPDTIIANYVHPSHVVVPRCTGKNGHFYLQIKLHVSCL